MSPICQTFVQNAWKKDLCSNCFKSEEEHGNARKDFDSSFGKENSCDSGVLTRRYVGVADRSTMYTRNYYGHKSWNPLMLDNSHNDSRVLRSPGLIKGMDSLIKQENEKNRNLNDVNLNNNSESNRTAPITCVSEHSSIPKDSWILSQLIGDPGEVKSHDPIEKNQGDSSSDLGSDASHDTSVSSGNASACSGIDLKDCDSDTSSLKSDHDSAHDDYLPIHGILKPAPSLKLHRQLNASITFKDNDDVIGYGGDVDYSDEEDYEDDDDDDNSSISSSDMSPEEKELKYLTEKNTNFNSENENLEKDPSNNEKKAEEIFGNKYLRNYLQTPYYKNQYQDDVQPNKQEVKVKLKRSHPIAGTKPQIKTNLSIIYSSPVISNCVNSTPNVEAEVIPMQGIKPKFVSMEEEMRENNIFEELYQSIGKVTSIDDVLPRVTSIDCVSPRVTSIDCVSPRVTSIDDLSPPRVTSIDDLSPPRVTSIDDVSPRVTSINSSSPRITSIDDLSPRVTSIDDVATRVTSKDDEPPRVTLLNDSTARVTSIDDLSARMTLVDDLSAKTPSINDVSNKTSFDSSPKVTAPEEFSFENASSESSSTRSLPSSKTPNINSLENTTPNLTCSSLNSSNVSDVPSEQILPTGTAQNDSSDAKLESKSYTDKQYPSTYLKNYENLTDETVKEFCKPYDYSIKSGEDNYIRTKGEQILKSNSEIDVIKRKSTLKEIENSKENLDKVSSAVIPINMITIQRRNSFMESQLGGPMLSAQKSTENGLSTGQNSTRYQSGGNAYFKSNHLRTNNGYQKDTNSSTNIIGTKLNIDKLKAISNEKCETNTSEVKKTLASSEIKMPELLTKENILSKEMLATNLKTNETELKLANELIDMNLKRKTLIPDNESGRPSAVSGTAMGDNGITALPNNCQESQDYKTRLKKRAPNPEIKPQEQIDIQVPINSAEERRESIAAELICDKTTEKDSNISVEINRKTDPLLPTKNCVGHTENTTTNNNNQNSFSTFGSHAGQISIPKSSFLHSGAVRPLSDTAKVNSIIYSTPEFLKEITSPNDQPTITASIQKSAIYASSSCLKGIPCGKPATTPKPLFLKDKPKIAIKPYANSPRIYCSTNFVPKDHDNVEFATTIVPAASSDQNKRTLDSNVSNCNGVDSTTLENRKPPPTINAPQIPKTVEGKENVYDVPVTLASASVSTLTAPSPTSSSSGYSSTSSASRVGEKDSENCHEINKNIVKKLDLDENSQNVINGVVELNDISNKVNYTDNCSYRNRFEANRNILSASLNFENKIITDESCSNLAKVDSPNPVEDLAANQLTENESLHKNSTNQKQSEANVPNCPELQGSLNTQHSYVNFQPPYDAHDVDSYSSFTDDFDDEDDDDCNRNSQKPRDENANEEFSPLRRTDRSSSAIPLFRNSVGPINFSPTNAGEIPAPEAALTEIYGCKAPAVRSHSVPRSKENGIDPSIFSKMKQESSSKFGFVRSGFFRPSSPPSMKRKVSSERGRETAKKSSGFSLRKLLRFASGDKSQKGSKDHKSSKESQKETYREARKLKLQIIHPLDYNPNGVEVIARPEKRSPAYDSYDFKGMINDPILQEALQHANENLDPLKNSSTIALFSESKDANGTSSRRNKGVVEKVAKKNSFLKRKKKPERKESDSEVRSSVSYVRKPINPINIETKETKENCGNSQNIDCENKSTCNTQDDRTEVNTHMPIILSGSLGFNSEGRPKPPPPPRKTSLDPTSQDQAINITNPPKNLLNELSKYVGSNGCRIEADASSLSSNSSSIRPNRPPPPRRTPSICGSSRGPTPQPPQSKDSLYANLGNARASFTPRKPGRSASIRDEEKEKRRAPNPPQSPQIGQAVKCATITADEAMNGNTTTSVQLRSCKGPAPLAPAGSDVPVHNHDYEYISDSSPDKNGKQNDKEAVYSASSSNQEKPSRHKGRRGSIVTNLSLEDQYGAVVFANLEALSNMLEQICNRSDCAGYESLIERVSRWSDLSLSSNDPISCGQRLFYPAKAMNYNLTVMVTPEIKVDVDSLLMPSPLVMFKDDVPTSILTVKWTSEINASLPGSVWVLPQMTLCSLEEFSHTSQRLLQKRPSEWERRICLFLLQIVTALKQLQAIGTEEASLDLVLVIEKIHDDDGPRLLMVAPDSNTRTDAECSKGSYVSLCHCAAAATQMLLGHSQPLESAMKGPVLPPPFTPSPHAFLALVTTLREERSSSLTKAKCILEAMLFGPENVKASSQPDVEIALQKWLDLERATVLHTLVKEQASGSFRTSILMKFNLFFLVRTNVKALREAMRVIEAPDVTDF